MTVKRLYNQLVNKVSVYLDESAIALLERAFEFADDAHRGQVRKSGAPYIEHPLNAAMILADMQLDIATIVTALLHDVPEDTDKTLEDVTAKFGRQIGNLVYGVTKLTAVHYNNDMKAREIDALRRLFLVMAKDVRVVLVKLADRLHNMRTLEFVSPEKVQRIARETLEIYSPLANLLSLWEIRQELDDICFRYLQPDEYAIVLNKVDYHRKGLKKMIHSLDEMMRSALKDVDATVDIQWKHLFSIYKRIVRADTESVALIDIPSVRVVVKSVDDCYRALGMIHEKWTPKPGALKDYIALPKPNGYRSLHTTVFGPGGQLVEVQIQTQRMHDEARHGAVVSYIREHATEGVKMDEFLKTTPWVKSVLSLKKHDDGDFIEALKTNVLNDRVFVFTTAGEMIDMPRGSSTLDYAYTVSKRTGNNYLYALVNKERRPMSYEVETGDIIEIVTDPAIHPLREWLDFVITDQAKGSIQDYFQKQSFDDQYRMGEMVLDSVLRVLRRGEFRNFNATTKLQLAKLMGYGEVGDFVAGVGKGDILEEEVLESALKNEREVFNKQDSYLRSLFVKYRGKLQNEKLRVRLKLYLVDRVGLLADIFDVLSFYKVNVLKLTARPAFFASRGHAVDCMDVEVDDLNQLRRTMTALSSIRGVVNVKQAVSPVEVIFGLSVLAFLSVWIGHPFIVRELVEDSDFDSDDIVTIFWIISVGSLVSLFYVRKFALFFLPRLISRARFEILSNIAVLFVGGTLLAEILFFTLNINLYIFVPLITALFYFGYRWSK